LAVPAGLTACNSVGSSLSAVSIVGVTGVVTTALAYVVLLRGDSCARR
jgi:hypothetical protein